MHDGINMSAKKLILSILKAPFFIFKVTFCETLIDKKLWNNIIDIYLAILIGCLILKNNQLIIIDYFTNEIGYYRTIGLTILILLLIKSIINAWSDSK